MSAFLKKRLPVIIVAIIFLAFLGIFVWKSNIKEEQYDWSSYDTLTLTNEEKIKYEKTIEKLDQNQGDAEALINLARLRNWGGDPDGAIKLYNEALKIRPQDTLILNNLADIYYSLGNYTKAEELNLKILEFNPKWMNAYRNLYEIYRYKLRDKYSQLPVVLESGLTKAPEMAIDFYGLLGAYYEDIGDKVLAKEYYLKMLEINPNDLAAKAALEGLEQI